MQKLRDKIAKGKFTTSISQVRSADSSDGGCYRSWWFKSVMALPQPPKSFSTRGDVLHEVCERYLRADDYGRDENGDAVNLYPPGWEESTNRWTGKKSGNPISESDKKNIKALISEAISSGMLTRMPGREIEKEFNTKLGSHEGVDIFLKGFVDLFEPRDINDHKSTSNRRYMKSLAKLRKDPQLGIYAVCAWLEGLVPDDENIWLSHLYYVIDKKTEALSTEKRSVEITRADGERILNERVLPVMKQMIELIQSCEDYKDVPTTEHTGRGSACEAYGGCPYLQVCSGSCTIDNYKKKINRMVEGKKSESYKELLGNDANQKTNEGINNMAKSALQLKVEKMRANSSKPTETEATATKPEVTKPNVKVEAKKEAPAKAESSDPRPKAPWTIDAECRFCSKSPVKGVFEGKADNVCPICKVKGKKALGVDADNFIVEVVENMIMIMTAEGDEVLTHEDTVEVSSKEKSESITEAKAKEAKEIQDKADADAVAKAKELQDKADEALKAQEEADAHKSKPVVEKEEVKEEPKEIPATTEDTSTEPTEDLEFTNERGRGKLLIGCAIIESAGTGNGKLGSPSLTISGSQLKEMTKKYLMNTQEVRDEVRKKDVVCWEDLNPFARKDLISAYGKILAEKLGSSTVQVRHVPRGTDLEHIVEAISPFMTVVAALAQ